MKIVQLAVCLICLSCLIGCNAAVPKDGLLFRAKEKGKWGFIYSNGKMALPPIYDDCFYQFSEGLAAVEVNGKWGYIDTTGKMMIPPKFDGAQSFENGIAAVRLGEPFKGQGQWGYIDKSGQFVIKPTDDLGYDEFVDGYISVKSGDAWIYIDQTGKQGIPGRFETARPFSEGLAAVATKDWTGFIDIHGNRVITLHDEEPEYAGFHEGLAAVVDQKTGKTGYINPQGRHVIPPQFDEACEFSEGRAAVCIETLDKTGWPVRKKGYIEPTGRLVIPMKYDVAWSFSEGLARVDIDGKTGFIDREGNAVIPCQFRSAESFRNGLAEVHIGSYGDDTGWDGYINKHGAFVWKPSDYREKDKARDAEARRVPSVKLFSDPGPTERGILVTCDKQVAATGPAAGEISIEVINYFEEDVFVKSTGFEVVSCHVESRNGSMFMGGGLLTLGENSYRLLHASTYQDGKRFTCGCCIFQAKGRVPEEAINKGPARGTVTVFVSGIFRKTGKSFCETIDLPIEVVEKKTTMD